MKDVICSDSDLVKRRTRWLGTEPVKPTPPKMEHTVCVVPSESTERELTTWCKPKQQPCNKYDSSICSISKGSDTVYCHAPLRFSALLLSCCLDKMALSSWMSEFYWPPRATLAVLLFAHNIRYFGYKLRFYTQKHTKSVVIKTYQYLIQLVG